MYRYLINSFCGGLLFSCWWFCLWVIAYYFVNDLELAILFFPFALRLGIALHIPKRYLPVLYGTEWLLTIGLALLIRQPQWLTVLTASIVSLPIVWIAGRYYRGNQWQRLSVMVFVIVVTLYLTEYHHYDLVSANFAVSLFEVGGFIGSLVAGWGSDKLFGGNRGPINLIFSIGIFLSVAALWLMPMTDLVFQSLGFFTIGFFVFGPQLLIGMAAAECSHKDSAGAATGFVGLFAYTGAALGGYPFAIILKNYHWTGLFITISVCAVMIGLLLLPFLQAQFPRQREQS